MKFFLGIDVQTRRDLAFYACDGERRHVVSRWFGATTDPVSIFRKLQEFGGEIAGIGIDSPRFLRQAPRDWYWKGGKWTRRTTERGWGRHCEVVVSAHRIANPQWTPLVGDGMEWMRVGARLFEQLEGLAPVFEVFPTASYNLLQGGEEVTLDLDLSACAPGPRDILDAAVAAFTVAEYLAGRGSAVGGGDGLGSIVLPRPLPSPIREVLVWPEPT